MQPRAHHGANRVTFAARQRCCTYHPRLANFLVGQALAREDLGSEKILARLQNTDGLQAAAVTWPRTMGNDYNKRAETGFGREESWGCPYWVEGPLGCSIHRDRGSICRSWFCKSVDGRAGWSTRIALRQVLKAVEETAAHLCVQEGNPPGESASPADWEAWYRWCADYVDAFDDARIEALRGEQLETLLDSLRERIGERDSPMPEVMIPTVHSWVTEESGVGMSGYSPYDLVDVPRWIFTLLSKLDGERTWREAQRATEAEVGETVSDDLIFSLHRRGIIGPPIEIDPAKVNPPIPALFDD